MTNDPRGRVMIAAPASGSGKTVFTCALLAYLISRGIRPMAFKCGPDYIDPMFHRSVLGVCSGNLDSYFESRDGLCAILGEAEQKTAVIEGVMGIYDGLSPEGTEGSCYEIAQMTKTPVILVMDARGSGRTVISLILGILADDQDRLIRGIIFNRMSERFYRKLRPVLAQSFRDRGYDDVKLLGFMPKSEDAVFESRYLGLKLPCETVEIRKKLDRLGETLMHCCDVDGILDVAKEAPAFVCPDKEAPAEPDDAPVLAVAQDEAFCFYYRENLDLLRSSGAELRFFSPLHDRRIPEDADGLLLGGGYPELYLEGLSGNQEMLCSIKEALQGGMPSLAECGGYMALHDFIEDREGHSFPMAGLVKGSCSYAGHLVRFGYLKASGPGEGICADGCTCLEITDLRGHEFHYYESTAEDQDVIIAKPDGSEERACMKAGRYSLWGFPHFYYGSAPEFVRSFIAGMKEYHDEKQRQIFQ